MKLNVLCVLFVVVNTVSARLGFKHPNTAFDTELYERVLDPELCSQQVRYLRSDLLLNLRFIDAGIRLPRGILIGNFADLGNYYQCLDIDEVREELEIQGKYCMIRLPLSQNLTLPGIGGISEWSDLNSKYFVMDEAMTRIYEEYEKFQMTMNAMNGNVIERTSNPEDLMSSFGFRLAVCIPKPCSVEQAMTSALFNLTMFGLEFEEQFCRLPNDKPWRTGDYVAIGILSAIGLLTILSTCYDLNYTFIQKRDPKKASALYRSFSVYTNGKRLTTFSSNPNSLDCLDGIRTLAMLWVVVGHTFLTINFISNLPEAIEWLLSAKSLWITVSPYTVDTFFMMTGVLLVYTSVGKLTGPGLLKKLHLFYLNRILRLFPLLALTVLLQVSLFNTLFDGPYWETAAVLVQSCREHWWTTLLHIQNYATDQSTMCISHSWYVAIDVQLHIVSPLVLYWVLSKNKRTAWIAMSATLTLLLAATTYYNTYKGFPSSNISTSSTVEANNDYMVNYYYNTFTRAAPFFVGMVFGYILYTRKGQKPKINIVIVLLLWACTFVIFGVITYGVYETKQPTWDNNIVDVIINSYSRTAWSVALGWIIFACVHGYGGPINWFLSLDMWKMPARLSYAMYLLHYPLQFAITSMQLSPNYFSVPRYIFTFLAYASLTYILSFFACLLIDAPFSVLVKLALGDGPKKQPAASTDNNIIKTKGELNNNENGMTKADALEKKETKEDEAAEEIDISKTEPLTRNGTEGDVTVEKNDMT